MLIGQGVRFELWDALRWKEGRDAWLAADDTGERSADLETLSW